LLDGMDVPLPNRPEVGKSCVVSFHVAVPSLSGDATLTFELRGDSGAYQLPQSHTVVASDDGGTVPVELTVTPNIAATSVSKSAKAAPMEPPLWLDCRYELGAMKATASRPVMMK
jgi:hypothetical protein